MKTYQRIFILLLCASCRKLLDGIYKQCNWKICRHLLGDADILKHNETSFVFINFRLTEKQKKCKEKNKM